MTRGRGIKRLSRWPAAALLPLLAVVLWGCVKNEFRLEFAVGGKAETSCRLLYYASDPRKGWLMESMAELKDGKGEFTGITRNPTLVYLTAGGRWPVLFIYAERGDRIEIKSDGGEAATWDVGGNKINRRMSEWRKSAASALAEWARGSESGRLAVNKAVTAYVGSHTDDPVSALLLLLYYDRGLDEMGYASCMKKLTGKAAEGNWKELVSRNDMAAEYAEKLPERIVLNTVATGCDTIDFGRVPTLLYFSKASIEGYRSNLPILREAAAAADSSRRVVANILLEPDSLMRWQNARHDSLRNVVEGWVPMGVSDTQMQKLGVRRLPFVIVTDTRRRIVYRGDDLRKGLGEFKKLTK